MGGIVFGNEVDYFIEVAPGARMKNDAPHRLTILGFHFCQNPSPRVAEDGFSRNAGLIIVHSVDQQRPDMGFRFLFRGVNDPYFDAAVAGEGRKFVRQLVDGRTDDGFSHAHSICDVRPPRQSKPHFRQIGLPLPGRP
ncbi:hypothetical protein [Nitrospirillum pindoramense]|uniref:hypothetical protein n=1 Tax=Nitrospirillum amazonense TaxID=28077 RepID=UPI001644A7DF|nr:hypothetical protein [Nitrospirillum amazonense]